MNPSSEATDVLDNHEALASDFRDTSLPPFLEAFEEASERRLRVLYDIVAEHLSREFDFLFTCLRCPGLDATNYRGEEALRPAVVTRKVWGGNRTENGAHTQEVLTSILRTSHQQQMDPALHLAALLCSPRPYVLDLVPSRASPQLTA